MALLFMDGFDWQNSTNDFNTKWYAHIATDSAIDGQITGRRGSSKCARMKVWSQAPHLRKAFSSLASGVIGVAIYRAANQMTPLLAVTTTAVAEHLSVRAIGDAHGQIYVSRNGTTLWTSDTPEFRIPVGMWTYVEFKFVIDSVAGSYSVRVNGSDEATHTQTGINTAGQGATAATTFKLEANGSGNSYVHYDDCYICDLTGGVNNDFLGDSRIDTLYPTSDGTHTDFTPSTGVTHYTLVDESVPSTVDYNSSNVVNAMDSYGMADLAFTPTLIYGVKTRFHALKVDSGSRSVAAVVKTEGVEYPQTGNVLSTGAMPFENLFQVNPNTGVLWTTAEVNALEVGVKVTS